MLDAALIHCPYCGEPIEVLVDSSVESQHYIEDCQVCCRPMQISVEVDEEGTPHVRAASENDG
ncbi:CPXCG motif-containing cysteine-rich protein [Dyella amyloliquefaciens]|uniref:CPXCG motif-containing cysteine-rich protein n=1 Tax=Dyella amyloliquefaciens TaxID=1770545 RepID=UPI00102EB7B6|nr:CPXCG motif-containing cysteine-rich protein [Dyella amyloliquefaciens]